MVGKGVGIVVGFGVGPCAETNGSHNRQKKTRKEEVNHIRFRVEQAIERRVVIADITGPDISLQCCDLHKSQSVKPNFRARHEKQGHQ